MATLCLDASPDQTTYEVPPPQHLEQHCRNCPTIIETNQQNTIQTSFVTTTSQQTSFKGKA